jgi:hypothetical protein
MWATEARAEGPSGPPAKGAALVLATNEPDLLRPNGPTVLLRRIEEEERLARWAVHNKVRSDSFTTPFAG